MAPPISAKLEDYLAVILKFQDFLRNVLGIDGTRADDIACKMEHTVDPPALECFICFLAFVGSRPESGRTWLQEFREFLQRGTADQSCKECIQVYLDNVAAEHHDER